MKKNYERYGQSFDTLNFIKKPRKPTKATEAAIPKPPAKPEQAK